ncbi:Membrane-associated progesterone receptor component 1 [Goodea atripinnis]|uniref:Membrane-associated progesterone receptor component 1 n=1 Tax=Goodea atripinnis TaxID=208336 RepID=A0ABV0N7A4_9TELE
MAEAEGSEVTSGGLFQEIFTSPLNLTLLSLCLYLLYKIFRGDRPTALGEMETPLPKMKKRDFTLAELKPYDGVENPRILMAVNGKVFDVTRGKKFYGPVAAVPANVVSSMMKGSLPMNTSC